MLQGNFLPLQLDWYLWHRRKDQLERYIKDVLTLRRTQASNKARLFSSSPFTFRNKTIAYFRYTTKHQHEFSS